MCTTLVLLDWAGKLHMPVTVTKQTSFQAPLDQMLGNTWTARTQTNLFAWDPLSDHRCMKIYRWVAPNIKNLHLQRVFQTSRPTWTVDQRLQQVSLSRCSRPLGRHRAAPDRHRSCMPAGWRVHDTGIASEGGHTGRAQAGDILYGDCHDDVLAGACPVTYNPFLVTHVVWESRKGARDKC